jgi:DNA-binding NarL/FixJ family response regulator
MTNKEIATRLGLRESTIKSYLRTIYARTGLRNRAALAAAWVANSA